MQYTTDSMKELHTMTKVSVFKDGFTFCNLKLQTECDFNRLWQQNQNV